MLVFFNTGKPRVATIPAESCPEADGDSTDSLQRSSFSMLKDEIKREIEEKEDEQEE